MGVVPFRKWSLILNETIRSKGRISLFKKVDLHLELQQIWKNFRVASPEHVYSILFYPITLKGRRGTTDEFATTPFHLDLFSAALVELAKSIPVHYLILSSHLFFCLPLFLFPFTVPCRIVFAKPEDLETWPNHLNIWTCTHLHKT